MLSPRQGLGSRTGTLVDIDLIRSEKREKDLFYLVWYDIYAQYMRISEMETFVVNICYLNKNAIT